MVDRRRAALLAGVALFAVLALGGAFAGTTAANVTTIESVNAENVSQGDSVTQTVTLQGVTDDGTGETLEFTLEGTTATTVTDATVNNAGNFNGVTASVNSNIITVDIPGEGAQVTDDITLEVTLSTINQPATDAQYFVTAASGTGHASDAFGIQQTVDTLGLYFVASNDATQGARDDLFTTAPGAPEGGDNSNTIQVVSSTDSVNGETIPGFGVVDTVGAPVADTQVELQLQQGDGELVVFNNGTIVRRDGQSLTLTTDSAGYFQEMAYGNPSSGVAYLQDENETGGETTVQISATAGGVTEDAQYTVQESPDGQLNTFEFVANGETTTEDVAINHEITSAASANDVVGVAVVTDDDANIDLSGAQEQDATNGDTITDVQGGTIDIGGTTYDITATTLDDGGNALGAYLNTDSTSGIDVTQGETVSFQTGNGVVNIADGTTNTTQVGISLIDLQNNTIAEDVETVTYDTREVSNPDIATQGADARITEGDNIDVSVLARNTGGGTKSIDVTLDIGNGMVTDTVTTSQLAVGENETVTFYNVTGSLSAGEYAVETSTPNGTTTGTLEVLPPVSDADSEVAVTVSPPGEGSFASGAIVDIFAGAYTDTSTTRTGIPNADLTVSVEDPDGNVLNNPVTTGRNGEAETQYDLSGHSDGTYTATVQGFGKGTSTPFSAGPVVNIMTNRNAGIFVGEQATVSALVRSGESGVGSETVDVTVIGPNGTTVSSAQKTTDQNGFVDVSFTPSQTGEYEVTTQLASGLDADTVTLTAAEATLGASYDLRRGVAGEQTVYGGYLRTPSGQLTNTNLTVTFRNSSTNDIVLQRDVTTDDNGFFLVDYQTPDGFDSSIEVEIVPASGETVHARFDRVFVSQLDTADTSPTLTASVEDHTVTPGGTAKINVEAFDSSGNPITNQEIDVYAGWSFDEVPALSETVVTGSDGTATVTYDVPENASNDLELRGEAAFVRNGERVSDGLFTRVRAIDIRLDSAYSSGTQSKFSLSATEIGTDAAVSGVPVQFAALYTNYKTGSFATGELVTNASGQAAVSVSIPNDVGPTEGVNYIDRYTPASTNRIVRPYSGTLSVETNRQGDSRPIAAPGEEIGVEFVTPNGEAASGIVFGDIGNPRGSVGTEVVGDEPTTMTIPQYAEDGEYARLKLWAYGEGQFFTDTASLSIEEEAGSSDSGGSSGGSGEEEQQGELAEGPSASVSTSELTFGDIRVDGSETRSVTISNSGDEDLTLDISIEGDDAFGSSATLLSSESISPGTSATYNVRVQPTERGEVEGTLVFDTNDGTEDVSLSARGVDSEFELVSESVDFGTVAVGATPTEDIVVRNNGTASMTVGEIAVGGTSGMYELDSEGGFELAAGEERTVGLTYAPETGAEHTANVAIDDENGETLGVVSVTGSALESQLSVTPDTLAFGEQSAGSTATRDLTLEADLTTNVTLAVDSDQFAVQTTETAVEGDDAVTVSVAYEPTSRGMHNATLTVRRDDGTTEGTVALNGTGTGPKLRATPNSLQFDNTAVNETVTEAVTVTNAGEEPLGVTNATVTGADEFALEANASFTLGANESRDLPVSLSPESAGAYTGDLRIRSNSTNRRTQIVSLSSGDIERTVEVDEENRLTMVATVKDAKAGEPAELDLPDPVEDERYETENVTVVPDRDGDLDVNVTSSEKELDTTPDTDAGFQNGTKQVGNLSAETNLDNADIREVEITTRIDNESLEEIDTEPENVALQRYNESREEWVEQETEFVGMEDGDALFRARGDGFSEWTAAAKTPVLNISETNIDVETATTDENVLIQVLVTNTGGADGSYEAVLFQNGDEIDRQERTVPSGGTVGINFERTFADAGDYQLEVNEVLVGEVTISAAEQEVEVDEVEDPQVEPADDTADGEETTGDADGGETTEESTDDSAGDGPSTLLIGGALVLLAILAGAVYYRQQS